MHEFSILYRWRLAPGKEEQFQQAWERITRALLAERNSLGSRLHLAADGTWVAYAQWPDQDRWQQSMDAGSLDPEASAQMADAITESFDPILLRPISDYLK